MSSGSVLSVPRVRFYVELKPGQTTFVSWRKLTKEHQRSPASEPPPLGAHPALEARIAPDVSVLQKDPLPPPPNRFNSVIEKIERIYKGGDSSDENENLGGTPDDDQYDTADSFIDDTELDEYFSVDKVKLKHEGFFINRGKLERENEPITSAGAGPKKRKQKDAKELSHEAKARKVLSAGSRVNEPQIHREREGTHKPQWEGSNGDDQGLSMWKSHDSKSMIKERIEQGKHHVPKKTEMMSREGGYNMKGSFKEDRLNQANIVAAKPPSISPSRGKDMSPFRPKGTAFERAIQELEKAVAQACPPLGNGELEQGKRNRLPEDVKKRLGKVARLAEKQGKVSEELIERLMGILGHIIQVKTLKKHLKEMIELGLSAKQEKEGRLQDMKQEVTAMVKSRVHSLQAQGIEQRELSSDDFQPSLGSAEKAINEGWYRWDEATEDKICDLYEQYIEGMDENKGPHVRKLYAELAELWPDGWMDNIGIKLAVQRAKDRKRKLIKSSSVLQVGEKPRKKRRLKQKLGSAVDRVPFLNLNLPGTVDVTHFESKHENTSSNGGKEDQSTKLIMSGNIEGNVKGNLEKSSFVEKKVKRNLDGSVLDTMKRPFASSSVDPHSSTIFETPSAEQRDSLLYSTTPKSFLASLEGRKLQVPAAFFGVGWAQAEHPDAWENISYEGSIIGVNAHNKKLKCVFKGDSHTYSIPWSELKDYLLPSSSPSSQVDDLKDTCKER